MRYFTYSPIHVDEQAAFRMAYSDMRDGIIVDVTEMGLQFREITKGTIPRAIPNTYLVRVEQDDSLRVVHTCLT